MPKGSIDVAEHEWAQEVYKVFSWPFEEHDGDPTPAKIAAHCKQKITDCKASIKKYAAETKKLKTQAEINYFAALDKNCQNYLSRADGYLKANDIAEANSAVENAEAILNVIDGMFNADSGGASNGTFKPDASNAERQKKLDEYSKRLAFYGAQKKEIKNPQEQLYFTEVYKQADWNIGEIAKNILNGNLEQADNLLFQTESSLKGLEGLIALSRKNATDLSSAKAQVSDAKSRIASAYKLRKTIGDKQALAVFEDRHKQAKAEIKITEGLIKKAQIKEVQPALTSLDRLVEQLEYAVGTNTWVPLDGKYMRELNGYKTDIQMCYQQINMIPDKAAKREFEQHYQTAINLVADTEVIIEGEGRAAEEKVKSNIAMIKYEFIELEQCIDTSFSSYSLETDSSGDKQPTTPLQKELDDCRGALEAAKAELQRVAKNKAMLSDPQIAGQFREFAAAAQSYISEGLQYVANDKLQEARGKLQTSRSAITSMEFLLESSQATTSAGPQPNKPHPQAQHSETAKDQCKAQHQAVMGRINSLLSQEALIHEQKLLDDFATYKLLADQMDSVISDLLQRNKVDDAFSELGQLEGMAQNLQSCIDQAKANNAQQANQRQANEQQLAEERQKASAYRQTLNNAQKTEKRLKAQQAQISDPNKQQRYAALLIQIGERIGEIGRILVSSQGNRIQLIEQLLPGLEGYLQQAQDIYDGAMAAQQFEEQLRKKASDLRVKVKEVAARAAALRKKIKSQVSSSQQQGELGTFMQHITEKIREINLKLNSQDANRVEVAEGLLPELYSLYQTAQTHFVSVVRAEKQHKEPKQKEIRYEHAAKGIRNNVDSREKPTGRNPEFYCERQDGLFCLKHSINACLGFQAITPLDMEDGLLKTSIEGFKNQSDVQIFGEVREYYPGLTIEEMRKQIAKDPDDFYRKAAKKQFEMLFGGMSPADHIRANGSEPLMGIAIMKTKQKELGLPELKDTWLNKPKTEADLQANVQKIKEITDSGDTDRLIVGAGEHFIALRKNAEDDWFEVDSQKPSAKRIELDKYIREKALQHKNEALAILHFKGDVNLGGGKGASQQKR